MRCCKRPSTIGCTIESFSTNANRTRANFANFPTSSGTTYNPLIPRILFCVGKFGLPPPTVPRSIQACSIEAYRSPLLLASILFFFLLPIPYSSLCQYRPTSWTTGDDYWAVKCIRDMLLCCLTAPDCSGS